MTSLNLPRFCYSVQVCSVRRVCRVMSKGNRDATQTAATISDCNQCPDPRRPSSKSQHGASIRTTKTTRLSSYERRRVADILQSAIIRFVGRRPNARPPTVSAAFHCRHLQQQQQWQSASCRRLDPTALRSRSSTRLSASVRPSVCPLISANKRTALCPNCRTRPAQSDAFLLCAPPPPSVCRLFSLVDFSAAQNERSNCCSSATHKNERRVVADER